MYSHPDSNRVRVDEKLPLGFLDDVTEHYDPPARHARDRAAWYGLVAGVCHVSPPPELVRALVDGDLVARVQAALGGEVASDWEAVARSPDPAAMKADFHALFKVPGPRYLAPNESVWADTVDLEGKPRSKPMLMGPSTVDMIRRWSRIGREVERSAGELPDYLGIEVHYIECLCDLEARAWEDGRAAAARSLLDQERAFLDDHLLRWVGPVCDKMLQQARHPFYRGLGRVLPALVRADRTLLGSLLDAP